MHLPHIGFPKLPSEQWEIGFPIRNAIGLWKKHVILVCMKTGVKVWFCRRQLDLTRQIYWGSTLKKFPELTVLLKILLERLIFQLQGKKIIKKEKPPRNVRLRADAREEIKDNFLHCSKPNFCLEIRISLCKGFQHKIPKFIFAHTREIESQQSLMYIYNFSH